MDFWSTNKRKSYKFCQSESSLMLNLH